MFLEFLESVTGVFVVVYDGQHALKFTLGRAQGVVGPGVHFKVPIIQKFAVRETKHTTLDLEPQVIQLNDDLVYEVDAKVMYQIVDLRKALIEIDDLVTGLQNRVVMAVQKVIQAQTRETIRDTEAMVDAILETLRPVEEQWGVRVRQFGFSNLSPSPSSLEITQLDLLARERLSLYSELRAEGVGAEAAVALVTGAVVATHAEVTQESLTAARREERRIGEALDERIEAAEAESRPKKDKSDIEQAIEDASGESEDEERE
jgi:regulator of protease activity HflC (stomatin/prohibitin superfamily)